MVELHSKEILCSRNVSISELMSNITNYGGAYREVGEIYSAASSSSPAVIW
jgi:hypothetical protein